MKISYDYAKNLQTEIQAHRQYIHKNAELGMELPITTAYVKAELEKMGYEPKEICKSGILATVGGKKPGKVFLLRGDMDALPLPEESDLEFKATNGNMHACGHDFHASMLLGAAKILKEHEDDIEGTIKLMFQPGEETLEGAKAMVEAKILENPAVDGAMMVHVFTGLPVPAGMFIIPKHGPSAAASDWFKIVVQGKGGHGAMPNYAVDPLNVISHIHIALQAINSREIQPTDSAVLTVGKMGGGTKSNIIPDTASMEGTIRTFSTENREFIAKRIVEISEGVAKTFRATVDVEIFNGCPPVVNHENVVISVQKSIVETFGQEAVLSFAELMPGDGKMMGSEDFAFVTEKVPGLMIALTAGNSDEGYPYPQHHPMVKFDEAVLYKGALAYAQTAISWLIDNK